MSDRAASRSRSPCHEIPTSSSNLVDTLIAKAQKETISNLEAIIRYKEDCISTLKDENVRLLLRVKELESEARVKDIYHERDLKIVNIELRSTKNCYEFLKNQLGLPTTAQSSQ